MTGDRPELLSVSLELWHPDCWALQVTDAVEADLLAHGAVTDGRRAHERYVVTGETPAELDRTVGAVRDSPLTDTVAELGARTGAPAIGTHAREIYVEFEAANSIDSAFLTRGFVYDGRPRMVDGREEWSLFVRATREDVGRALDAIRTERDAEVTLTSVATVDPSPTDPGHDRTDRLTTRQREAIALARENGYYEWPRAVTAQELADELGVAKPTFLEHLRRAESKLLDPE